MMTVGKAPMFVWCEIACAKCEAVIGEFYEPGTIGRIRKTAAKLGWKDFGAEGVVCPTYVEREKRHGLWPY